MKINTKSKTVDAHASEVCYAAQSTQRISRFASLSWKMRSLWEGGMGQVKWPFMQRTQKYDVTGRSAEFIPPRRRRVPGSADAHARASRSASIARTGASALRFMKSRHGMQESIGTMHCRSRREEALILSGRIMSLLTSAPTRFKERSAPRTRRSATSFNLFNPFNRFNASTFQRLCLPLLLTLLSPLLARAQPSSLAREDFWVPDGPVNAIVETNGAVYIGGLFEYISPVSLTGNAFDLVSGAALPGFPKVNGAIKAIVADNAGGWFIGGLFTSVGGVPVTNLVHIRADKTVDTNWVANPDDAVLALVSSSDKLYVGGSFLHISGQPHSLLAAIDPATGAGFLSWTGKVTTTFPKPSVNALALADGRLYIGGYFSFINGAPREHVGSVDAANGADNSWYPNGYTGAEAGARVDALAISGSVLYVGGTFSSIGGLQSNAVPRHYLAALDTTKDLGASVLPWNPDANGPVTSFALSCDTVYAGGSFTSIGGQARSRIAAVDLATGLATAWNPGANSTVLAVALAGNTIYAGGKFTQIGGQAREFLAALDTTTGEATLWHPKADFGVAGISISGGAVIAGGALGPGGKLRSNAAAFDVRTGQPLDWNPQITDCTSISGFCYEGVYAMAASSNLIYFGGPFRSINGQSRNHAGAVDSVSGAVSGWHPNADGIIETLLNFGGAVYAGGRFTSIGGQTRTNLAALDPATGLATGWNPGPNDKVTALAGLGSTIYSGGLFTRIGGQLRNRLAALDSSTGAATAWNPNVNDQVSAISISGPTVYVGGQFSKVSTQAVNRLAALDISTGSASCWLPTPQLVTPAGKTNSAAVNALIASGNLVYAGGSFTLVAGQPRNNLSAINTNCPGAPAPWDPNADQSVSALVLSRGVAYSGGFFQTVGGQYRPYFAVFPPNGSPRITTQPLSQLVAIGQNVTFTGGATGQVPLSYQWQMNGTNLPGATNASLLIPNAQVSNSGEYMLVVTNALGLVSSRPATLTVLQPIAITAQPASQTVAPGVTVNLSVTATGNPAPTYQWRLNGVNIPGAIYAKLTLTNAQPTDGGSYSVLVANIGGVTNSTIASVVVTTSSLTLANNLGARVTLNTASGLGSASNVGATKEAGEPNHAGKVGGASVWLGWRAPSSGIATFSARGSGLDTLLGIYTGAGMSNLVAVANDDDRAGFATSQASFNAVAGVEYLIAIDGFAGASGNIVLGWSLDTTTVPFPRIFNQPLSETVFTGSTAMFSVEVTSPTAVTYQWFFGCRQIIGATSSSLVINNAQQADVGNYRVLVMNASSKVAVSLDAFLEIGPEPKVVSHDKLEDLLNADVQSALTLEPFNASALQRFNASPLQPLAASGVSGFVSVSAGTVDAQLLNNTGATTQQGEPSPCGVIGGSSKWFGLQPATNGMMLIDTIGSAIDTVMAVYTGTNLFTLKLVACDNNSAPDGIRSLVLFPATNGVKYAVAVDGVNGAQGPISLNWKFDGPPTATNPPANLVLPLGTTTTLYSSFKGIAPLSFQWFWNNQAISRATNAMLLLSNLQTAQAGTYSLMASNFAGATMATIATVKVGTPIQLGYGVVHTNGGWRFRVTGTNSQNYALQGSTNLTNWVILRTNSTPSTAIDFVDPQTPINPRRFYRVVPWP